jgi:hypothetical protein
MIVKKNKKRGGRGERWSETERKQANKQKVDDFSHSR